MDTWTSPIHIAEVWRTVKQPGSWLSCAFLLPLLLSLALTRMMVLVARHRQWVVKPKIDRWHRNPTALYGGVAIFITFALGAAVLVWQQPLVGRRFDVIGLFMGGAILFVVGVRDDARPLNPLVKLFAQMMAAMPLVVGVSLQYRSPSVLLCMPLLLFWQTALTNAFNLLDNMDGLSAGAAAIAAGLLAVYAWLHPGGVAGPLCALLCASCLGFLWFNFRLQGSARIFMGDCGSLFLGHTVGGLTVLSLCPGSTSTASACALPLLVLALPLFDTSLVIVLRKREGRAISQGGKDHSSHRLVYAGCSEKQAVLILWCIGLAGGLVALLLSEHNTPPQALALSVLVGAVGLGAFGGWLSHFSGYPQAATAVPAIWPAVDTAPIEGTKSAVAD